MPVMTPERSTMDRRRFLLSTVAGGFGLSIVATSARSLTLEECSGSESSPACREVIRHRDLAATIDRALKERGLTEVERQALLVAAMCPFCGQALFSSAADPS